MFSVIYSQRIVQRSHLCLCVYLFSLVIISSCLMTLKNPQNIVSSHLIHLFHRTSFISPHSFICSQYCSRVSLYNLSRSLQFFVIFNIEAFVHHLVFQFMTQFFNSTPQLSTTASVYHVHSFMTI